MRKRLTVNEKGELVCRDGSVLGRIVAITLELEAGEGGTTGGVGLSSSSSAGDSKPDETPNAGGVGEPTPLFEAGDQLQELWDHYTSRVPGGQKVLTPERRKEMRAALAQRDLDTCKRAIDWLAISPHHNGQNETGATYLELKYAIGKVRQSQSIGDRIDEMAKRAPTTADNGQTTVDVLLATVPSESRAIVKTWISDVEAWRRNPDHRGLRATGEARLRMLRERVGVEPVPDGSGWRRVERGPDAA